MADLTIRERLWNDFSAVAKKRHKRPEALAQELIQEYIQRVSDEDLLEASAAIARRAPSGSTRPSKSSGRSTRTHLSSDRSLISRPHTMGENRNEHPGTLIQVTLGSSDLGR